MPKGTDLQTTLSASSIPRLCFSHVPERKRAVDFCSAALEDAFAIQRSWMNRILLLRKNPNQ
jgi:hypothetical protein